MTTWETVQDLEDGTYSRSGDVINDYSQKWAYGYMVGIGSLCSDDFRLPGSILFGVWTDDNGKRYYDRVRHVDALSDALILARQHGELAIWDMRREEAIYL